VVGGNAADVPEPFNGTANASAHLASVTLEVPGVPSLGIPPCLITAEGLATIVSGSVGAAGDTLQLDPASGVADLSVCGTQVTAPGSPHVFPLPGGIGTLTVFDRIQPPGYNSLEAVALYLQVTCPTSRSTSRLGMRMSHCTDGTGRKASETHLVRRNA